MATRNKDEKLRDRKRSRIFSASFKKQKVREIERKISTVGEVSKEYEVSRTAIYKWLDKYSVVNKRKARYIVEPMSDTRKIAALKARIKELEQMIGQKQIQLEFKEKMIELAEQHYKIDIKKNFGLKQSSGSGGTGKSRSGQ